MPRQIQRLMEAAPMSSSAKPYFIQIAGIHFEQLHHSDLKRWSSNRASATSVGPMGSWLEQLQQLLPG